MTAGGVACSCSRKLHGKLHRKLLPCGPVTRPLNPCTIEQHGGRAAWLIGEPDALAFRWPLPWRSWHFLYISARCTVVTGASNATCRGTYVKAEAAAGITPGAVAAARAAALQPSPSYTNATAPGEWVVGTDAGPTCSDPPSFIPGFQFYPQRYIDAKEDALQTTGVIIDDMTSIRLPAFAAMCYRCSWCYVFDTTGRIWGDFVSGSGWGDLGQGHRSPGRCWWVLTAVAA